MGRRFCRLIFDNLLGFGGGNVNGEKESETLWSVIFKVFTAQLKIFFKIFKENSSF